MTSLRNSFMVFLVLISVPATGQAQAPREAFQAAVAAYQQQATEAAVESLAKLYKEMTPPPAIPEQAEFHAQKGAAFVELAKTPADYLRGAQEFQAAIAIAPWVGEYHYNLAICYKSAEQFASALTSLQFAQILARDEKERREAVALRAKIEAAQEVTTAQKAEDLAKAKKAKAKNLIVPGVGIGEVRLGMSESEVISVWGSPSKRLEYEGGGAMMEYSYLGASVVLSNSRTIRGLGLTSRGTMATREGVSIGASMNEVSAAMGIPYYKGKSPYSEMAYWCYRGITFYFDKPESGVTSVTVDNDTCK